jgi:hypothetical protein
MPAPKRGPDVRTLVLGAVVAVAVVGSLIAVFSGSSDKRYTCDAQVPAPSGSVSPEGIEQPNHGNTHVTPSTTIEYPLCPPTSGSHYAQSGQGPLRPGFYGPGDVARPGGWVHNLEHGFIVALYKGEPDASTLQALRRFVEQTPSTAAATACGYRSKVLVARFDDMTTPFAVLAWDHLLQLTSWDETSALTFAQRWMEQATGIEPNSC